ncbi:hypothetical protein UY3_06979 [Chelonia mydas]|uniref:Uncharacterized protein n=1 Tax=Chelonia mydas TaxID=8469 RepID=M7C5G0_CHEMY|nr:hypothetical protein UY3_06979 [Chelonia mydas]
MGSDRYSGGRFIASRLDAINQLPSTLPSTPILHQGERRRRSRRERVSRRLTVVKTPRHYTEHSFTEAYLSRTSKNTWHLFCDIATVYHFLHHSIDTLKKCNIRIVESSSAQLIMETQGRKRVPAWSTQAVLDLTAVWEE